MLLKLRQYVVGLIILLVAFQVEMG